MVLQPFKFEVAHRPPLQVGGVVMSGKDTDRMATLTPVGDCLHTWVERRNELQVPENETTLKPAAVKSYLLTA